MKEQNFKFKKSFGKLVEQMTDKQAGEFIKAVCGYVFLQKPMESKDEYLKGVLVYVKAALDTEMRDRENGKLGGAIVAEKYKGMRGKAMENESIAVSESMQAQVIIVSAGEQNAAVDEAQKGLAPKKKRGRRPKTVNAADGGGESPNEKKDDRKAV